jgi:hypothetical protein
MGEMSDQRMRCARLTIGKKYNAQVAAVHLSEGRPEPNPTVTLNLLLNRMFDNVLDRLQPNRRAIRALTHVLEVSREPHFDRLAQAKRTRKERTV